MLVPFLEELQKCVKLSSDPLAVPKKPTIANSVRNYFFGNKFMPLLPLLLCAHGRGIRSRISFETE